MVEEAGVAATRGGRVRKGWIPQANSAAVFNGLTRFCRFGQVGGAAGGLRGWPLTHGIVGEGNAVDWTHRTGAADVYLWHMGAHDTDERQASRSRSFRVTSTRNHPGS